jgi:hypothetical protein
MYAKKSYPNSGALFPNDGAKEGSPAMTGTIKLSTDLLKQLEKDEDGLLVLRIAAWKKQGAKGSFLSISASKPQQKTKEDWE